MRMSVRHSQELAAAACHAEIMRKWEKCLYAPIFLSMCLRCSLSACVSKPSRQSVCGCLQKAFAAERIQALMDVRRSQEVDAAACHAVMMRKKEDLMQRLHKAEEALQHSTRDYILCKSHPDICWILSYLL